jgi:hypothetical protein
VIYRINFAELRSIVGIIHYNGEHVASDLSGKEVLRFFVTFVMSWKIWSDVQQSVSWFETNDVLQRVSILFVIACLLGLATLYIS